MLRIGTGFERIIAHISAGHFQSPDCRCTSQRTLVRRLVFGSLLQVGSVMSGQPWTGRPGIGIPPVRERKGWSLLSPFTLNQ